jgi:hypothetical protein
MYMYVCYCCCSEKDGGVLDAHKWSESERRLPKLTAASVIQLLYIFLRYYAHECDVCGSVLTLRGQGQVITYTSVLYDNHGII